MSIDYHPKTKLVPASSIRRGDVVMEREAHPARVERVSIVRGRVTLTCRYVWQSKREFPWQMAPLPAAVLVAKAVRR